MWPRPDPRPALIRRRRSPAPPAVAGSPRRSSASDAIPNPISTPRGVVGIVQHSAKLLSATPTRRAPSRIDARRRRPASSADTCRPAWLSGPARSSPSAPPRRRSPHHAVAGAMEFAHAPQMPFEIATADELVQGQLADARRLHVDEPSPLDDGVDQRVGQGGEPDPQRGRQRLGERADVGHPTRRSSRCRGSSGRSV